MTKAITTEEFHAAYDGVRDDFETNVFAGSIHNFLWQIIINRINEHIECTFHPVLTDGKLYLCRVVKDVDGFVNSMIAFKPETTDMAAHEICSFLNSKVFGQSPDESDAIVSSSFEAHRKNPK